MIRRCVKQKRGSGSGDGPSLVVVTSVNRLGLVVIRRCVKRKRRRGSGDGMGLVVSVINIVWGEDLPWARVVSSGGDERRGRVGRNGDGLGRVGSEVAAAGPMQLDLY